MTEIDPNVFFSSMAPKATTNSGSIVTGGSGPAERSLAPPAIGEGAVPEIQNLTDEQIGQVLYGGDAGAGDPLPSADSYDHISGDLLDAYTMEARGERNSSELKTLIASRQGLNQAFHEFSVGQSEAKEVLGVASEYFRNPKDAESAAVEQEVTDQALQRKWGKDYDRNIQAARRVVADLNRRIPQFADKLNRTGLGNNQKLIETLARAGNRQRTSRRV